MTPLGLNDLFFVDLTCNRRPRKPFAATELCPVRNRLLVGEVHDDNAWFAGGIDGHAGLFGTAKAVFQLLRGLSADLRGQRQRPYFSKSILPKFFMGRRQTPCRWDSTARRPNIPARAAVFQPTRWGIWGLPVSLSGWTWKKMPALFCLPTGCIPFAGIAVWSVSSPDPQSDHGTF
jgi:hypothetical protein